MNGQKSFKTSRHSNKHFSLRPKAFIFIERFGKKIPRLTSGGEPGTGRIVPASCK